MKETPEREIEKPSTMDISHIRIEALEGLDPDLRYLLYVNAKGDDGNLMDRKSFVDALTGLQEWLRSVGIQAMLIPVTGRDDDLKIKAVEIKAGESNG